MSNNESLKIGGGATLLSRQDKGFDGISLVKILRYYGSKALRSNIRHSKTNQDSCVRREPVILKCLRHDNTLNIGGTYHVIPHCLRHDNTLGFGQPINVIPHLLRDPKKNFKRFFASAQNDKSIFPRPLWKRESYRQKAAFTLAEVLITLAIIGIVAAMTIPTLISNYQKKTLKTQFTQTYSLISQAVGLMKANLPVSSLYDYYIVYDPERGYYKAEEFKKEFLKYIKVQKTMDASSVEMPTYYTYDGSREYTSDSPSYAISKPDLILANGAYLRNHISGSLDGRLIFFQVDINGTKGPNRLGHDLFTFMIKDSNDVLVGRKMLHLYTEDEWKDNQYAGAAGLPCSVKSTQSANGVGCAWYALKDVCPGDETKGYWECLPR